MQQLVRADDAPQALATILPSTVRSDPSLLTPEQLKSLDEAQRARDSRDATRRRVEARAELARRMGRRYGPDRATLDGYRVEYHEQAEAVKVVKAVARNAAAAGRDARGIVLYGTVGTGKDHLLAALLYAVADAGLSASWVNGQEVYSRFRDAMDSKKSEESIMAGFTSPQVLGISDPIPPVIDPHKPTAWRTELLFRVIDRRYRDCRPTWMTVNAQDTDDL